MLENIIIIRDWESGSRNPYNCQPLELAAIALDPKSLEIIPNSKFYSKICYLEDEQAIKEGFAPVEDEALRVNKLIREDLKEAPSLKMVWQDYTSYLDGFNRKRRGKGWDAPIACGFNSSSFDDIIDKRLCNKFGPQVNERGDWMIYHPNINIDLYHHMHTLFNNLRLNAQNTMNFDVIRDFMGMDKTGAHSAMFDVYQTAFLLIKYLRLLKAFNDGTLNLSKGQKVKFKDCFSNENKIIENMLNVTV